MAVSEVKKTQQVQNTQTKPVNNAPRTEAPHHQPSIFANKGAHGPQDVKTTTTASIFSFGKNANEVTKPPMAPPAEKPEGPKPPMAAPAAAAAPQTAQAGAPGGQEMGIEQLLQMLIALLSGQKPGQEAQQPQQQNQEIKPLVAQIRQVAQKDPEQAKQMVVSLIQKETQQGPEGADHKKKDKLPGMAQGAITGGMAGGPVGAAAGAGLSLLS